MKKLNVLWVIEKTDSKVGKMGKLAVDILIILTLTQNAYLLTSYMPYDLRVQITSTMFIVAMLLGAIVLVALGERAFASVLRSIFAVVGVLGFLKRMLNEGATNFTLYILLIILMLAAYFAAGSLPFLRKKD